MLMFVQFTLKCELKIKCIRKYEGSIVCYGMRHCRKGDVPVVTNGGDRIT